MADKRYLKVCEGCLVEYVGRAAGNCPHCGSTRWRYLDSRRQTFTSADPADRRIRVVTGIPRADGSVMMVTDHYGSLEAA